MRAYLEGALLASRATRTPISFLLHPLDLLGGDEVPSLAFFPGMDLSGARKREIFKIVLRAIQRHFEILPMGPFAERVNEGLLPERGVV